MTNRATLFRSTILCGVALLSAEHAMADQLLNAGEDYTVTDPGATENTIIIGNTSGPATFNVIDDGTVVSTSGIFGYFDAADGNSGLIAGIWTNNGTITVGNFGSGNTLTIQGGGTVSSQSTWIGGEPASTGNAVIVDGVGSKLDNSTDVTVGYGSAGNGLTIRNGATSINGLVYMGLSAAADNNTLTVTGLGSSLVADFTVTDTGLFYLGVDGSDNTMNVLDRATVTVDKDMLLGANSGSNDNTLNISDAGSKLEIGGRLYVGRNGNNNGVVVENGGALTSASGRIGGGTGSTVATNGNSVTVKGDGSTWTLNGSLRIGDGNGTSSANNFLSVEDGGEVTVTSGNTTIGTIAADSGNQLRVTGSGSTYTTVGSIIVGTAASNSLLSIDNGGLVKADTLSVGGTSTLYAGSGSTLEANGLTLQNGSLMRVAIDFEDPVNITLGAATLDGNLEAIVGPKGILGNRYSILTSTNPIVGEFDNVSVVGLSPSFNYTYSSSSTTERWLSFTSDIGGGENFNKNQQNVADTLNDYFNAGGSFAPGFGVLTSLTGEELAQGLSQVSGEVGATGGARALEQATTAFLGLMMQNKGSGQQSSQMMAAARLENTLIMPAADVFADNTGWTMWGGIYGGTASLTGDEDLGSHDTDTDILGIATGWDHALSGDTTLGFALAGGGTRWDLADQLGSGDSTFLQFGAHGTQRFGASYLSLAGAYAWHWMETERTVTISDAETLDAEFDASNLAGRIEGGHRFGAEGALGFTPYAALQGQAVYMPDYEEDGGDFAVAYDEEAATAVRSELGLRLDLTHDTRRLHAGLAWAHAWRSDADISASFVSLRGTSFIVNGADAPEDVALVSAGADFGLGGQTRLTAGFDGEFGEDYASYGGSLALTYEW
jgi:T5SS/PEP-CTERM-associated repeat protein